MGRFYVECFEVEIIDVFLCVAFKEGFLVDEAKSQGLKALVKQLHVLLAHFSLRCLSFLIVFPVKDISGIVNLVVLHFLSVSPYSGFDEPNLRLLVQLMLNLEPNIALVVDLVHELDQ